MRVTVSDTWFEAGAPKFLAGIEYDFADADPDAQRIARRLIERRLVRESARPPQQAEVSMQITMTQTWYEGGLPKYEAGATYDLTDAQAQRLINRGHAVAVQGDAPAAPVGEPGSDSALRAVRAEKRK